MKYWFFLFGVVLFLSACQQQPSGTGTLYSGSEGISMKIENAPSVRNVYFDKSDPSSNTFDLLVGLENRGSSYAIGRVFPSGFDRSFITVRDERFPNYVPGGLPCSVDAFWGENGFNFGLNCENVEGGLFDFFLRTGEGNRPSFGGELDVGELFPDSGFLDGVIIDFGKSASGDSWIKAGSKFSPEFGSHGRLMSAFALSYLSAHPSADRWFQSDKFYLLDGKTVFNPVGDLDQVLFRVDINEDEWPADLPQTEQQFLLTNCYAYATYATPSVCIDPQPWSSERKVCSPGSVSLGSQGAPVSISRVDQEVTPKKVFFTVHVSHDGRGTIYDLPNLHKCDPWSYASVSERDLNTVTLGNIIFSGSSYEDDTMECVPKDRRIKLFNGQGSITCAWDVDLAISRNAYQAPLLVELWYGYGETVQHTVNIKRIG